MQQIVKKFADGYRQLQIPLFAYDFHEYFRKIPSADSLEKQHLFFLTFRQQLQGVDRNKLNLKDRILFDHLSYEIDFNLKRVVLESYWKENGSKLPQYSLYELPRHEEWYHLFIQRYTGLYLLPAQIADLGNKEVTRVNGELLKIQERSGLSPDAFKTFLNDSAFLISDENELQYLFERTDSTVRSHLKKFVGTIAIPPVYPIEWPGATAATPPGMYINKSENSLGKSVFQYNFSNRNFNRRAVEWLYLHEAIPGHHLQFTYRSKKKPDELQQLFLYPGNFEGWGCYVEYYGSALGLYRDANSYYGKWEWDLVRSARLQLDEGIHNKGWTKAQAQEFWESTLPNQNNICAREINRVTNWAAQAITYKAGADFIAKLRSKMEARYGKTFDLVRFHRTYLSFGMRPLWVIEKNFEEAYEASTF
ncbi:MAG: DUF885 family protein [Chitinophagales bacterium]